MQKPWMANFIITETAMVLNVTQFFIVVMAATLCPEVKLGGEDHINAGAASMIELARNIDTDKMPAPSFMAVIIGVGQYAYQRQDGVYVIPIGCLKD